MIKGVTIVLSWLIGCGLIVWGIAELTSWIAYPILGGMFLIGWGGYKPLFRLLLHGGAILDGLTNS